MTITRNIAVVLVILLALLVVAIFLLISKNNPITNFLFQRSEVSSDAPQEELLQPSGKILLSLLPKNSERLIPVSYIYDVDSGKLSQSDLDLFDADLRTYTGDFRFSPNGQWAAFKGFKSSDVSSDNWKDWDPSKFVQFYRSPVTLNAMDPISDRFEEIKNNSIKLTDMVANSKQLASINDRGEMLIVSVDNSSTTGGHLVDAFTIRHIGQNGEAKVLTNGFNPQWVSNESFVFLKRDGLYAYSVVTNTESLLWEIPSNDGLSNEIKMSTSNDGRYVAISIAYLRKVFVLGLFHDDSNIVANGEYHELPITGFWPTFSPDDEFLVIQGVDANNIASDPKPFLNIWRTRDFSRVNINVDLNDFQQPYMFVDDWIQ